MDPTVRFSSRVANYARYRPGYPRTLIDALIGHTQLAAGSVIADIGAGTGQLTRPLLDVGLEVYAVEPNTPMREALAALLDQVTGFHAVAGRAEETSLAAASVDMVAAAQAFHWFDRPLARKEFARILKPEGWVALVWNDRDIATTPFLAGYEALLLEHGVGYDEVGHKQVDMDAMVEFFGDREIIHASFANAQLFDCDSLLGRVASASYCPEPGHPNHPLMMDGLRDLFDRYNNDGAVAFTYQTTLYLGHLGPA